MHKVGPKVFLLGETRMDESQLHAYLEHIGATEWDTDAESDPEMLTEVMSRSCYDSFTVGLNPNVSRVREGNAPHLANIVKQGHGSVMEHAVSNWMFCNVSRVFTHELVRHRAGTAISQQSLRFVRLEDMGQWMPEAFRGDYQSEKVFNRAWADGETHYRQLLLAAARKEGVDSFDSLSFEKKKYYTSAARRVAPIGLATNIGWSCNMRALRLILEARTHPSAEEEIRLVFGEVGAIAVERWPNLFADYAIEEVNGLPWYKTENRKV